MDETTDGVDAPGKNFDSQESEPETGSVASDTPVSDGVTSEQSGGGENGARARTRWAMGITVMAGVLALALITTQILTLNSLNETKAEIGAMQEQIGFVGDEINGLAKEISDVGTNVEELALADALNSDNSSSLEPPSQTAPAGYLPRFDRDAPDQALGMTLGSIDGMDGYSEELVSIDPADGTRRIWMVWAHWCPYCQQELPILSEWYPTVADQYEAELVTVSTNIDPSRENPLDEYLAESQFPFPVVVDTTNDAAVKMGVSAFPFWVITDGDGVVLLRAPGLLDVPQMENLFTQLETLDT